MYGVTCPLNGISKQNQNACDFELATLVWPISADQIRRLRNSIEIKLEIPIVVNVIIQLNKAAINVVII